jgi:hypothetical protein
MRICYLASLILLTGCGSDQQVSPMSAEPLPALNSRTHLLDAAQTACLDTVDVASNGLLLVITCDLDLGIGTIVVGPDTVAGGGFLRRVEDAYETGEGLWLTTTVVPLEEALDEPAKLSEQFTFDARRATTDLSGIKIYEDGVVSAKVTKGTATLNPTLTVDAEFGWGGLETADVDVTLAGQLDLDVKVVAKERVTLKDSATVASVSYPFAGTVGPIPVYGSLELSYDVGFKVTADAKATARVGMSADAFVAATLSYDDGDFSDTWSDDFSWEVSEPALTLDASATAKVFITPRVSVVFYETVGAGVEAQAYAKATGELDGIFVPWSVDVGVDVDADLTLAPFSIELASKSFDLADWETPLLADTDGDGALDDADCAPSDPELAMDCGQACATDELADCLGGCTLTDWLGDGVCDPSFDCPMFIADAGDCSDTCIDHSECGTDEVCDGLCVDAFPADYWVTIEWASAGAFKPDGSNWDIDFSEPDIMIGFGTATDYAFTSVFDDQTYAYITSANQITMDGSAFTVDFYDSDFATDDHVVTWVFDTSAELMMLAQLDNTSMLLTDTSGTIDVSITTQRL